MESTSLHFAEAARVLADGCRPRSLTAPSFRSPPRIAGDRSIRRRPGGGATVSVRYRQRPWPAVLADMVEGVVATNRLVGAAADECRTALWRALEDAGVARGGVDPLGTGTDPATGAQNGTATVRPLARVA